MSHSKGDVPKYEEVQEMQNLVTKNSGKTKIKCLDHGSNPSSNMFGFMIFKYHCENESHIENGEQNIAISKEGVLLYRSHVKNGLGSPILGCLAHIAMFLKF